MRGNRASRLPGRHRPRPQSRPRRPLAKRQTRGPATTLRRSETTAPRFPPTPPHREWRLQRHDLRKRSVELVGRCNAGPRGLSPPPSYSPNYIMSSIQTSPRPHPAKSCWIAWPTTQAVPWSKATALSAIARHMLGLYGGEPGAREYRRTLSEGARVPEAGPGSSFAARSQQPVLSRSVVSHWRRLTPTDRQSLPTSEDSHPEAPAQSVAASNALLYILRIRLAARSELPAAAVSFGTWERISNSPYCLPMSSARPVSTS